MQKSINRSLADPYMDDIDHALGRPKDPLGETYRNHYATYPDSMECRFMESSMYWEKRPPVRGDRMKCFVVTKRGKQALADYLSTQ